VNLTATRNPCRAFSFVELLVVIASLALFVVLVRPVNPGRKKAEQVVCLNNLRQTVLGFVMWSDANGGAWPWQASTNQGGTMELIPYGRAADHFLTLSNYLKHARLLVCPTDQARHATNDYSGFGNQNLSYFAGLDAIANGSNRALSVLGGDRHLQVNGKPVPSGLLVTSNESPFGWTQELHAQDSQTPVGNLSFADGHVEFVRADHLSATFQRQSLATNRLAIP
jgi:prepilin-type processing-associated H-X9-DG protein